MSFPYQILHNIALYVNDPHIAQLILIYNKQYNKYVRDNPTIMDELVWKYMDNKAKFIYVDDLKTIQSIFRLRAKMTTRRSRKIPGFLMTEAIKHGNLEAAKWLYEIGGVRNHNEPMIRTATIYNQQLIINWLWHNTKC